MRLPDDTSKFSHQFKYYEVARFVNTGKRKGVIRENGNPKTLTEISKYAKKYNNTGIYTSVFAYNSNNVKEGIRLGPMFFDLDAEEDIPSAISDARKLITYFEKYMESNSVRLYFSGSKGFHIQLEPLAIAISPSKDPKTAFRHIANHLNEELKLTTLDFQCYDNRRMWRLLGSKHQKTGLYKTYVPVDMLFDNQAESKILNWAESFHEETIPEQKLSLKGAQWYRSYLYDLEKQEAEKEYSIYDKFNAFNKSGSRAVTQFDDEDLEFDPIRAFEGCESLNRLWKKAESTHDLAHEERLFLCSLLTYSDDAMEYLYAILGECSDFDPDRSKIHIDDWIQRRKAGIGGRPYTCRAAKEKGIGCLDCNLEPKKKYKKINGAVVETGEVADPSPIRFLYRRKNER